MINYYSNDYYLLSSLCRLGKCVTRGLLLVFVDFSKLSINNVVISLVVVASSISALLELAWVDTFCTFTAFSVNLLADW